MSKNQSTNLNPLVEGVMKCDVKILDSLYTEDARETIINDFSPFEKSQLWATIKWAGSGVTKAENAIADLDKFIGKDSVESWIATRVAIYSKIDREKANEIVKTLNVIKWFLDKNLLVDYVNQKTLNIIDILSLIINNGVRTHSRIFVRYAVIMKMITYEEFVKYNKTQIIRDGILEAMLKDVYSELGYEINFESTDSNDE